MCAKGNRPMVATPVTIVQRVRQCPPRGLMMLTIGILVTVTAVFGILRLRIPAKDQPVHLGSMSERWLAEHRASH